MNFWWTALDLKQNGTIPHKSAIDFSLKWRIENKFPNLELVTTKLHGYAETPNLGGVVEEEFFMADRSNKFALELPIDLEHRIGDGKLMIDITVETHEGRNEDVFYSDGPTFKHHPERKTWQDAENTCIEEGIHLASVVSWQERDELMVLDQSQEK